MSPPPVVVFDVGSTLIHPDFEVLRDFVADRSGFSATTPIIASAFRRAIAGDVFSPVNDEATQARRFFSLCGYLAGYDPAWSSWWAEIVQSGGVNSWLYTSLDADARGVLQNLQSNGCRLIAASNSNGTLRSELAAFGLLQFFEATYDSADLRVEKPAREFYDLILDDFPGADQRVHVGDDLIKDFIAPIAAGFSRSILYDPADTYAGLPIGARIHRLSILESLLRTTL